MNSLTIKFKPSGQIDLATSWEHFKLINSNMIICIPDELVLLNCSSDVEGVCDSLITDLEALYDKTGPKTYKLKNIGDPNYFVDQYNKDKSYAARLYFCYTINMHTKKTVFEQCKDFI